MLNSISLTIQPISRYKQSNFVRRVYFFFLILHTSELTKIMEDDLPTEYDVVVVGTGIDFYQNAYQTRF